MKSLLDVKPFDMAFLVDESTVIRKSIAADERMLFRPSEEILGHKIEEILPQNPGTDIANMAREVLLHREPRSITYDLKLPEGTRSFHAQSILYSDPEAPGHSFVLALIKDITETKNREAALADINGRCSAMIHELRTPLQAILDLSDRLGTPNAAAANAADITAAFNELSDNAHLAITLIDELTKLKNSAVTM